MYKLWAVPVFSVLLDMLVSWYCNLAVHKDGVWWADAVCAVLSPVVSPFMLPAGMFESIPMEHWRLLTFERDWLRPGWYFRGPDESLFGPFGSIQEASAGITRMDNWLNGGEV